MSNTITYSVDTDGIATVVIDVKDRSMNVATREFMLEFDQCIDTVAADEAVVGAIVTSGKSSFFAGADLMELVDVFDGGLSKDDILELYLNHIYFGHGRYGIEEASRYYFGKSMGYRGVYPIQRG